MKCVTMFCLLQRKCAQINCVCEKCFHIKYRLYRYSTHEIKNKNHKKGELRSHVIFKMTNDL